MRKGTARRHRQIRQMKEGLAYESDWSSENCDECGKSETHAEWCLAEDEEPAAP